MAPSLSSEKEILSSISFRDWSMDSSSMGLAADLIALRILSAVFPPCPMASISSTPMKKGRASGASQSRVTEPPPGRFRA